MQQQAVRAPLLVTQVVVLMAQVQNMQQLDQQPVALLQAMRSSTLI
jgi:hypothetical protein